jgi:hypothetical protein
MVRQTAGHRNILEVAKPPDEEIDVLVKFNMIPDENEYDSKT